MQGKLRLKAHKLWSHLAVSFRKLPQTPPPRRPPQGARSAAENMHRLRPSYTRLTCSEIHSRVPSLRDGLRMAIYTEMHVSHVNFKNVYEKYSATNKTVLSADSYMTRPTRACTKG